MTFEVLLCALFAWLCLGPFTIEASRALRAMNDALNRDRDMESIDKAYSRYADINEAAPH